jgi:hypothetical protein
VAREAVPVNADSDRSSIEHSFYPAAVFENGLVANQPTKKFCEIAAIAVSPSNGIESGSFRAAVGARNPVSAFA